MLARLPLKGPILGFAAVAVALGGLARFAERKLPQLVELDAAVALGPGLPNGTAGGPGDLGAFAPLAGSLALAEDLEPPADAPENQDEGAPAAEAPERVYPAFEPGSEFDGRHGPAPHPAPRNVVFTLCTADGSALHADRIEVDQAGGDGARVLNAYRDLRDPARWTAGSPGVTTGVPLSVRVRAWRDGVVWQGTAGFEATPNEVTLELGTLVVREE